MNRKWFQVFQFVFLLGAGVILILLSFRKISFDELLTQLKLGDYWICLPVLAVSAYGYYCRISRWKLMLNQMGEDCRKTSLYAALCMGYTVSFVVPRLGEVSRALIIKKTDGTKIDLTLISIVAERMMDALVLSFLLLIALVFNFDLLLGVFRGEFTKLSQTVSSGWLWVVFFAALLVMLLLLWTMRKRKWFNVFFIRYKPAIAGLTKSVWKAQFWTNTLFIWACYYLMTYLWFNLFEECHSLTWKDAFMVMIVGSFGRSIPIQGGGMGAYHFVVGRVLLLIGLPLLTGNALALVIHGAQTVFTLLMGTLAYLWMMIDSRKGLAKITIQETP